MIRTVFAGVVVVATMAGCGGDDSDSFAEVAGSAVPSGEPEAIEAAISHDEGCVRSGGKTLVFVEGQATLGEAPPNPLLPESTEALEVRFDGEGGSGRLVLVPFDAAPATATGYPIEPDEWVTEPPPGCDGPYFVVTDLNM